MTYFVPPRCKNLGFVRVLPCMSLGKNCIPVQKQGRGHTKKEGRLSLAISGLTKNCKGLDTTRIVWLLLYIRNFFVLFSHRRKTVYYRNCPEKPYLHQGTLSLTFEGKLRVLLLDVDEIKICSKRPNGVDENAFFVVDRSQLKGTKDWLTTDVASFEHHGSSARVFTVEEDEIVGSYTWRGKKSDSPPLKQGQCLVKNVYHRHKKYNDFVRTATTVSDSTGSELQLGLIEYCFMGSEHHISPHKNPWSGKSYIPTTPSTRDDNKLKVTSHKGPLRIFDETIEEAGGIVHCKIATDMPRDFKQISNARQDLKEKEKQNEFVALLGHAKQDAGIRNMQWTPNPRVVFATDQQFAEIVEECCAPGSRSILSIDTTYNVGDFYVTSTTYQSSKFIQTRTGKGAVLPGPTMLQTIQQSTQRHIQLWWTCDREWRRWHQQWIGCSLWGRICTQHCCNNLLWLQRACKRKALCTFTTRALWYFHSTQRKKDIQPRRGDHHQNQFEARNGLLPSMALASTTMTWKKGS